MSQLWQKPGTLPQWELFICFVTRNGALDITEIEDCKHERHKGVTTENGWQAECSGEQLDTGPHLLRRKLVTHRCNLRASICEIVCTAQVVASYGGGAGLVELWSLKKVGHIGGGAGGSVWFAKWLLLLPIRLIDARDLNIFLTHQLICQFIAPPTLSSARED